MRFALLLCLVAIASYASANAPLAAQQAAVQGIITNADTGEPLEGASVVLEVAGEQVRSTLADRNGFYQIGNIAPGPYTLRARYLGYAELVESLLLEAGEGLTRSIRLQPDPLLLEGVTVRPRTGAVRRELARQRITPGNIRLVPVPAASRDLAAYLQTLPGVVTTGDRGGQMFIRGGTHTENLALMDGLLIYQPFHILGFFSAFPEELISSVDFYAGGYGARYSGRTSSVLDVRMRDGNRNEYAGTGSVSPFVAEAVLEGPMWPGRMSFLASARRSLLEETSPTILGETQPLAFESQFAKLTLFGAGDSRCSAMFMHTDDRGRLDSEDPVSRVSWENLAFGGRCVDALEGTHRLVDVTFGFSRVRNAAVTRGASEFFADTRRQQLKVSTTDLFRGVPYEFGAFVHLDEWRNDVAELFSRQVQIWPESRWEAGSYVETELRFGDRIRVLPGAVLVLSSKVGVEPRVRASWQPLGRDTEELSASLGLYRQGMAGISDTRDAGSVFVAWSRVPEGGWTSALHAILGWQQSLSPTFSWSFEGYLKRIHDVPVPIWQTTAQFNTDLALANGRVYGADLRLEYNGPRLYGFVGYGYGWTQYEAAQDLFSLWFGEPVQRYHPPHDRRHQINAVASLDVGGFTVGTRWQLGSGLPFTRPIGFDEWFDFRDRLDDVHLRHGTTRVILDKPYQGRLPLIHRLDLSVNRTFQLPFGNMEIQAGAINLYDQTNIFFYDVYTHRRVDQLPFAPYASLRLEAT
jgi:hypothetical protein